MWGPNFGPPLPLSLSFLLLPPSSFLPPLTLFTLIFTLIFLLPLTIFSQEKNFSKFLKLPLSISLNISLDPCVLEHFCHTPIFGETHFQIHLFFAPTCLLLPMDSLFLLFMARNMIQHLIRMMRRGSFKTSRPMLHILTWTSRWVFLWFLCLENCCLMLHRKFDGGTLSFCCVFLLEFGALYGWSCCNVGFGAFFELLYFWSLCNFDNVNGLWNFGNVGNLWCC